MNNSWIPVVHNIFWTQLIPTRSPSIKIIEEETCRLTQMFSMAPTPWTSRSERTLPISPTFLSPESTHMCSPSISNWEVRDSLGYLTHSLSRCNRQRCNLAVISIWVLARIRFGPLNNTVAALYLFLLVRKKIFMEVFKEGIFTHLMVHMLTCLEISLILQ
jgi:hypothetical protein